MGYRSRIFAGARPLSAASDDPKKPDDSERAADLAREFRAAADDLAEHLKGLPKAAPAILPAPRRVEAPRPLAPAKEFEQATDVLPEASDAEPRDVEVEPVEGARSAPDIAPRRHDAAAQAGPAPEAPTTAPLVARRLGADAAPTAEGGPIPTERGQRKRRRPSPSLETAPVEDAAPAPEKKPGTRTEQRRRPLLREFGYLCVSLGFLGGVAGLAAAFLIIAPWPEEGADLWAVNRTAAIVIEDRNGREIAARGARYGEAVAVGELPPYLVKAFLATEDRRFYEHRGVDLKGTARAFVTNLRSGGRRTEGGSTITQQLARNLFLSPEQTYIRKAKEAMLAFWLEGRYSKEQILSLYLNRIYFGAGAYGVESAAKTYFNKSARDVSLSEAALLAGLPQAPSTLAPTQNPLGAQDRAFEVIDNMRETGDITEFEAREARRRPPVIVTTGDNRNLGWFFDYVAEKARVLAGPDAYDIVIRTTLDQKLQRDAEAAVNSVLTIEAKAAGALESALIAYDNDGAVRAMVGGRSYVQSQFNRATQAKRQPGSAFKPIVYAAAFENGLTPSTRFVDQPIDIAGWKPTNYDQRFHGSMRITEAVAKSINTIAVQVSEKIGRQKVVEMARRLGLSSEIPSKEAGIALGGFSATLEELTAAYIPFAVGGAGVRPYAILEIADGRGKVLYRRNERTPAPVVHKTVARNMTHVLYQVLAAGTGRSANIYPRQAAGKTGTTNDWRDAWFIGYTAQMTAGVWVGNDNFQPMDKVTGGTIPAKIWKTFMTAAHADLPREPLDGAYVAMAESENGFLLNLYREILDGFRRVRRDGDEDRGFEQ
jgi:penicillin-binding protein 1A